MRSPADAVDPAAEAREGSIASDLIALTKPRIISLLLVTTIAAMYVAGSPSLWLVLVLFVGGYLMAGGANAVNMYLDRDIDVHMARTQAPSDSERPHVAALGARVRGAARYDGDVPARALRERAHGGARARRVSTATYSCTRAGSSARHRRTS